MKCLPLNFVLLIMICCQSGKYTNEANSLEKIMHFYKMTEPKPGVYIINGAVGCDGCKKRMADFFKSKSNVKNLYYILSSQSLKETNAIYPYTVRKSINFIHDTMGFAMKEKLIDIKPKVLLYKGSHVVEVEEINYSTIDVSLKKVDYWMTHL